jgi:hypothetical protein
MALNEGVQNYLEALGGSISEQGIPSRRFAPKGATFVSSALAGLAQGLQMKRALTAAREMKAKKADFERRTGIDYETFSKLGDAAQEQILKNSGFMHDPLDEPIEGLGGASQNEFMRKGLPEQTAQAEGSGVFEGVPGIVSTAPAIPPGFSLTPEQRGSRVMHRYGIEPTPTPVEQSLIESRASDTARAEKLLPYQIESYKSLAGQRKRSGAGQKTLSAREAAMIRAWLAKPENIGKTVDDAVNALFIEKPGALPGVAKGEFGETIYVNPDGSMTSDPSLAKPGARVRLWDRRTGEFLDGASQDSTGLRRFVKPGG